MKSTERCARASGASDRRARIQVGEKGGAQVLYPARKQATQPIRKRGNGQIQVGEKGGATLLLGSREQIDGSGKNRHRDMHLDSALSKLKENKPQLRVSKVVALVEDWVMVE
ncbi:hypothetical protein RSAG8_10872, partial [Rhizoctonia solani AG-8 WAC10335]